MEKGLDTVDVGMKGLSKFLQRERGDRMDFRQRIQGAVLGVKQQHV